MQGEALFEAKKRLSRLKKGVSLILLKSLTPAPPKEGMCSPKCFFLSKRASLACEEGVSLQ
ncbi:hypothetical protein HMPREF9969_1552 [Prevotella sp. oral taxon 306 str. F0472]|nr:hypothetical protein HMPREF9969_1552 [Prevotella sp. oral taxon 306 str. F0472]